MNHPSALVEQPVVPPSATMFTRVQMLDVVRGWCMFFIAGGDALCLSLCLAFPSLPFAAWVRSQLDHMQWEGFTFYDGLFPTFLLISGAAFTYSWKRQEARDVPSAKRWMHLGFRTLLLIVLGLFYNGALSQTDWHTMRFASVLARIGLGVCFAAIAYVHLPLRWRWTFFPVGLLAYVGLFAICGGEAPYAMHNNWAASIDRAWLPGVPDASGFDGLDPEGIVSTLGAILTAYLGMLLADLLRSAWRYKALWMALGGLVLLGVGYGCAPWVPIIKKLWTATYVCVAGGWSLIFCSGIYCLTDCLRLHRWFAPITLFGTGALACYLLPKVFDLYGASWRLLGGVTQVLTDTVALHRAVCAGGALVLLWCSVWVLRQAFRKA